MSNFYLNNKISIFIVIVFILNINVFSTTLISQKRISLSQEKAILLNPGSFFVTETGNIYVVDRKDSNIKIFNKKGQLRKIFGRRGLGPDEFIKPMYSTYKDGFVAIEDMARQTYFIYRIDKNSGLKIVRKCLNNFLSSDFCFIDKKSLFIAGSKIGEDKEWKLPYIYNFVNERYEYIIPIEVAYGYNSYSEVGSAITGSLSYIQNDFFCDINKRFLYITSMANLRVVRINRINRNVFVFGKKTKNYIKPFENREIRKAYRERNRKAIIKYINQMTNVMDIFVLNSGKVGLILVGPEKNSSGLHVFLQLYNNNGKLIKEFEIVNSKVSELFDLKYYFKKSKNLIYILEPKIVEDFDMKFFVHVIKIKE